MTDRRFDENDLLGWIEGDLPSDRADALERAMREDAGLRHTLDAMRRDRSMLRAEFVAIWREAGAKAPLRTVQEAIEAAEREAILTGAGHPRAARRAGVLAVIGRNRGLAMAASLGLMVTAGALVWTATAPSNGPTTGRQIAGNDALNMTDALADLLAIDSDPVPSQTTEVAVASGPTPEQIDAALAIAQRAESDRARTLASVPRSQSPWAELQSQNPVLPSRLQGPLMASRSFSNGAAAGATPASLVSWERDLMTYDMGGRDRAFTRVNADDIPEAMPATYDDAVRLAGLNRLTLRVVSDDPRAIERELFTLAALHGLQIELTSMGDACGVVTYSVSLPSAQPEDMERLVEAICACAGAPGPARRAYFDVTSLPSRSVGRASGGVNAGSTRVSVPVLIEPAGVH